MARHHWHPAQCRRCGKSRHDGHHVSQTGLCPGCASVAVGSNIEQMVARRGPNFARWRQAMAASVGGVLLDDAASVPQADGRHA